MRRFRGFGWALLSLATLAIGGVTAGYCADKTSSAKEAAGRFRFSESLRMEKTVKSEQRMMGSSSETWTSYQGKVKLEAQIPVSASEPLEATASTPLSIKIGGFEFHSQLGDDPEYAPGKSLACLHLYAVSSSGDSRTALVTARLSWDHNRVTINLEGITGGTVQPAVARDFVGNGSGEIKAETPMKIAFGNVKMEQQAPFTGRSNRKERRSETFSGTSCREVVTIDVKGSK